MVWLKKYLSETSNQKPNQSASSKIGHHYLTWHQTYSLGRYPLKISPSSKPQLLIYQQTVNSIYSADQKLRFSLAPTQIQRKSISYPKVYSRTHPTTSSPPSAEISKKESSRKSHLIVLPLRLISSFNTSTWVHFIVPPPS